MIGKWCFVRRGRSPPGRLRLLRIGSSTSSSSAAHDVRLIRLLVLLPWCTGAHSRPQIAFNRVVGSRSIDRSNRTLSVRAPPPRRAGGYGLEAPTKRQAGGGRYPRAAVNQASKVAKAQQPSLFQLHKRRASSRGAFGRTSTAAQPTMALEEERRREGIDSMILEAVSGPPEQVPPCIRNALEVRDAACCC